MACFNTDTQSPITPARSGIWPRWRGEHMNKANFVHELAGLSPLARGTLLNDFTTGVSQRFIPAGAGNTLCDDRQSRSCAVYPRWRGEHLAVSFMPFTTGGLSPLARGTPNRKAPAVRLGRFIPAGAGNTRGGFLIHMAQSVYPRWRGEHSQTKDL